jgi:hypothetical protein
MAFEMVRVTDDAAQLDGWIPVRLNWSDGRPVIDWCFLGKRGFKESSFERTVETCVRYPANLLFRHQTSIDILLQLRETRPGLKPTGFVFHMSRCGATSLPRMLAALPENIVISEARPIDSVLRAHLRHEKISDLERVNWLRGMVSALGQQRLGMERHLFIIFHSWNVMELPLVRSAFPDVPWVFLYRDPLEVLVSQLGQRGAATIPSIFPPEYFGMKAGDAVLMGPEEYCATVLAAICQTALKQYDDGGMLINYSELPEVAWSRISKLFGVSCSDSEEKTANCDTTFDRKKTDLPVQVDSGGKQASPSQRSREVANRLLYPVHERLETARLARRRAGASPPS